MENNKDMMGVTFTGNVTFQGPMFDIHDNEHVHIGVDGLGKGQSAPTEQVTEGNIEQPNEDLFHFVHPEIEGEEAWKIHNAVKRLVKNQKVKEICSFLRDLKKQGRVLLPESPSVAYAELVRMGMPTGEGFSEKYFSACYIK